MATKTTKLYTVIQNRKFKTWPSAYGSAWLVKTYKARGGTYSKGGSVAKGKTRTRKS